MTLGDYLAHHGLTAREFAPKVGVSAEAIRLYLKGERRPRAAVLEAIADETGGAVTANDFFPRQPSANVVPAQ